MDKIVCVAITLWAAIALASGRAVATDNKLTWPDEADELAALGPDRASLRHFCIEARSDIENFLTGIKGLESEHAIRTFDKTLQIANDLRTITQATGRHPSMIEIGDLNVGFVHSFGQPIALLCLQLDESQASLTEILTTKLEQEKKKASQLAKGGLSLAGIGLENVGCAATESLMKLKEVCHWWAAKQQSEWRFTETSAPRPPIMSRLQLPAKKHVIQMRPLPPPSFTAPQLQSADLTLPIQHRQATFQNIRPFDKLG